MPDGKYVQALSLPLVLERDGDTLDKRGQTSNAYAPDALQYEKEGVV